MKTQTAEVRTPEWDERIQPDTGRRPGAGVTAFVAVLLLALLAYGAWAQGAPANGATASETYRVEQPAGEGYPPQGANPTAARPHPRGLPRRSGRPRPRRAHGRLSDIGNARRKKERT